MASAAFQKALDKKKNAAKLMQKAKEAENSSGDFSVPEIEDGNYIARVKAGVGVTPKAGVPYVEFKWTIVSNADGTDSEFEGKGYRQTFFLNDHEGDLEREEKTWEFLGKTLKACLSPNIEFESAEDLEDLCKQITEEKPHVNISVKSGEGKKGRWISAYFNRRIHVTQVDPTDAPAAQDDTPSDADVIKKDDKVIYDDGEYVVVTSSVRTETCTIKSVDDPSVRHSNVSWQDLEVLE